METTEKRVTRLEFALESLIYQMSNFSAEMQEFKREIRDEQKIRDKQFQEFKMDLWEQQKLRDKQFQEFRQEIREDQKLRDKQFQEFKQQMQDEHNKREKQYKEDHERREQENKEFRAGMNKQWGELARKMGTIVEDIIFPGIEPLLKRCFNIETIQKAIRISKKKGALRDEFDIIAESQEYVFLVEVKSSPNHNHIYDLQDKIMRFKQLFTEYKEKKLIVILASLTIPQHIVNLCSKQGYYALAYRQWDYLDILNLEQMPFPPKTE